jgi:hypothetical protein
MYRVHLFLNHQIIMQWADGGSWKEEGLSKRLINWACFVLNSQAITQWEFWVFASRPSP